HQEPDRILKGDLRGIEAVEVRGIHHRANYSFRAKVKRFGNGQNTGETLPNFRQKSTEILKRIEVRRVKRSFVPDICQAISLQDKTKGKQRPKAQASNNPVARRPGNYNQTIQRNTQRI
ncbi:Small nuclear ribonucleoprotein family protein, partial [Prunus dulcis]